METEPQCLVSVYFLLFVAAIIVCGVIFFMQSEYR